MIKKKVKKVETHKMPDGSIMIGKKHKSARKTTVEPIKRKKQLMKKKVKKRSY